MAQTTAVVVADMEGQDGTIVRDLMSSTDAAVVEYVAGNSAQDFAGKEAILAKAECIALVVFAGGKPGVIADIWPLCPQVRWVHSLAAGVDTLCPVLLPLPRISDGQIFVTNARGAFSRSLAEYSMAAMLHFNKQIPRIQANRTKRKWDKFVMPELHGLTVGFVGFGDIAKTTARLCRAFGMRVVALRRKSGIDSADEGLVDEVFVSGEDKEKHARFYAQADYVVCSLPGTPQTAKFVDASAFAAMKDTAVFISIGRGIVVDENALADALQKGGIAGAALDVFATEPLPEGSALWSCDNILITAHNADFTSTYLQDTWALFQRRLNEFQKFQGNTSPWPERDLVDLKSGY